MPKAGGAPPPAMPRKKKAPDLFASDEPDLFASTGSADAGDLFGGDDDPRARRVATFRFARRRAV